MVKKYLINSGFLFLVFYSIVFSGCATLQQNVPKPTARVVKFEINKITFDDITFQFHVAVNNPYPVGLRLDGIDLVFFIEDIQVFKTSTSSGFTIDANRSRTNVFNVTLKYADVIRLVKSFRQKDYLKTRVDTTIRIPLPTMPGLPPSVSFNYSLEKQIPAIEPKVEIANFRVEMPTMRQVETSIQQSASKNLSPSGVYNMFNDMISGKKVTQVVKPEDLDLKFKVYFDIVISNRAQSPLRLTGVKYSFFVNSSRLVDGTTNSVRQDGAKTILTVVNEFSSKSIGSSVYQAFQKGVGAFKVNGGTTIVLPREISSRPIALDFSRSGNFRLR